MRWIKTKVKRIEDIDKNFKSRGIYENNIVYMDALESPYEIYGLPCIKEERLYCRLPQSSLKRFSESVQYLAWNTTGARVRFMTDSPFVSIKAEIRTADDMSHMPRSGMSGFDMYIGSKENKKFINSIMPESGVTCFEGITYTKEKGMKEWTINFPLYNGIKKLLIGLKEGSNLEKAPAYSIEKPIVFYGSSITHGGCASRPGNSYPNILSRWLDAGIYNLGFSGSAKGETEMAEYIAGLNMSAFVLDYDHNAPDISHLSNTHERFYKIVRDANKKLPIIIITKPDFDSDIEENKKRREVIYNTYKNAINSGDDFVYFIDGEKLFGKRDRDSCTVDGCHPNDLGFMRMADTIFPVLKKALLK
jgi:lysophospholipase L1-like esterase